MCSVRIYCGDSRGDGTGGWRRRVARLDGGRQPALVSISLWRWGGLRMRAGKEDEPVSEVLRGGVVARLRTYFLAGIIVAAPITLTLYIVWRVVDFFDTTVRDWLPTRYNPETYMPFSLPGIGLVLTIVGLIVIGWFAASYLGRRLMRVGDTLLHRMPVVRGLYGTLKQVFETLFGQSSRSFREVVLVEWPRREAWSVAFVTGSPPLAVGEAIGDELVSLFLPCTPNPTTGYFLMVPRRDVVPLALSVEDAMKLIISGGLVAPASPLHGPARHLGRDRELEPSA
jgi:uncharacterized membrane protein